VGATGLLTMVFAAWVALFKDDLKGLLAYSTISHLGFLTMLFGLGTPMAALVGVFHIINHATFKAALFLNAGIVDHEAGTRDIRRLGGLFGLMPIAGTLALIAGLSMAGVPPLNGFISKETFDSRNNPGKLITVSYWRDHVALDGWMRHPPHRAAIAEGKRRASSLKPRVFRPTARSQK